MQGTVNGGRRRGRQKKRWDDNIREWTGLELRNTLRKAEDREEWKAVVRRSSAVPRRIPDLRDRETIWNWADKDNRKINLTGEAFENIVQTFLTEIEREKDKGFVNTSINEASLLSTLLSLFIAGSETIANTIVFAVLYMVNFPHLQDQRFREIDDVIGIDRPPSILDKSKLKFLSAFIMET
ncbi:cytochrome p450 2b2 [Plakobranchus ocellatus]|uniref:Cytochrome p450 2b2 n=1 Tax=Plakobranchus ocellatus TaxID=259542 RepID=A0AAV4D399_9GAST|nr:cytochrome p450 2b2 [Plakobranchus ocellatus]